MADVHAGSWFGLPDLGITEAIGKVLGAPTTSQNGSNLSALVGGQNQAAAPQKAVQGASSVVSTVAGPPSGGTPSTTQSQPSSTFNVDQAAKTVSDNAAARQAAQEAQIRGNISSAYQPIFDELDRQIGALPGQESDLETQVGTLGDQQEATVNSQAASQKADLDASADQEKSDNKSALNDLSDNVRHILQGAQFYLGGLGAGDSSAVTDAAGAIGSTAEKARGGLLNTLNQGLQKIQQAKNDVDTVANQNLQQIENWKTNELATIKSQFQDQLNQLYTAKANAQGQEGTAIAQLITGTEQQFNQVLTNLDSAVFNYKTAVAQWADQRQATLDDNLKLLAATGQYSSTSAGDYATQLAKVGNSFVPVVTNKATGEVTQGQPVGLGNVQDQSNPLQSLFSNIGGLLGNGNNTGATQIDTGALQ